MISLNCIWNICKILTTLNLTRLEEIILCEEFVEDKENQRNAFKTCLKFRSTLTGLSLPYYDGTLYEIDDEYGDALDFLPSFDKLKFLLVQNQHDPELTQFSIQAMVPNLIELRFNSSFLVDGNLATPLAPLSWIQSLTLELPNFASAICGISHIWSS